MPRLRAALLASLLSACPSSPPPVTSCTDGTTACGSDCVSTLTDDAHCGSCGTMCSAGQHCANGACFESACDGGTCAPDSVCAQGACVARACVGVACGVGEVCSQGHCVCGPGRTQCGDSCVDLALDDANCGMCGKACAAGESCAGSACLTRDCSFSCDALSVCVNNACVERDCVGVVCPSGLTCHSGACGCAPGETSCGGACVKVVTDSSNCGMCGMACPNGTRCAAGQCLPGSCDGGACDPLSVCFQGSCTTAACVGVSCTGGKSCAGGTCACPNGTVDCGSTCAALTSDNLNCGTCGNHCPSGQSCIMGNCTVTGCAAGKTVCGGACVDTQTDPDNCNACGNACGGGRVCVGGACACPMGTVFCGTSCVNPTNDPNHCGGCFRSCNGGSCTASVCSCPGAEQLCSSTCVPTQTDPMNCGVCGHTCTAEQTCSSGTCVCAPGRTLCNGSCIPTDSDNTNCGGCGVVCQGQTFCNNSGCQPAFTCQGNFTTAPADCPLFPLDASKCGVQSAATSSSAWSAMVGPSSPNATQPFSSSADEVVEVTGMFQTGAFIGVIQQVSSLNQTVKSVFYNFIGASSFDVTTTGSVYTCAQPAGALAQWQGQNQVTTVNGQIVHYTLSGKYNSGSTMAGTASLLSNDATSGRVCDQVCGDVKNICGDDREFYRFSLPAKKGAVIDATVAGQSGNGSNFNLVAANGAGGTICNLVANANVGINPGAYRARIVNNTGSAQVVTLYPQSLTGPIRWNFAVGVEP
jgi:hypothetical protein